MTAALSSASDSDQQQQQQQLQFGGLLLRAASSVSTPPVVDQPSEQLQEQEAAADPDDDAARPYHAKRPHKKSRTGCINCKARKVKCDEGRPACRSCRLRKAECTYPVKKPASASPAKACVQVKVSPKQATPVSSPGTASAHGDSNVSERSSSPEELGVIMEPEHRPNNTSALGMRLLWFYTTMTSSYFSIETDMNAPANRLLKVGIVQLAFEKPFLMDSLFALASMHMQSVGQGFDDKTALLFRARAFEGYRHAIEAARSEDLPALISNSLFLIAISSQHFREEDTPDLYILEWIVVWRGIGLIMHMVGIDNVFASGHHVLFKRPQIDLEKAASFAPNTLLFMLSAIRPDDPDYPEVQTYYTTLKYLGSLYYGLREGFSPVMNLRIVTWFSFLPATFLELARMRRPRALIILAYYCVFCKAVDKTWWFLGIGDRSLRDICKYLDSEWQDFLAIPRMALDIHDALEVARLLLQDPEWDPTNIKTHQLDPNSVVTLVDNMGRRRVEWVPADGKLVMVNHADPIEGSPLTVDTNQEGMVVISESTVSSSKDNCWVYEE